MNTRLATESARPSAPDAAHIWIVDDDRSVRFVLATALGEAGFRVTAFGDAGEVLDALAAGRMPDLLLTDVRMPGESGLALLDKLHAKLPQLPIIVMSAHTDITSTASAFRGGAKDFLSKPFDLDEAVALVQRALPETAHATQTLPSTHTQQDPLLVGDTPTMRELFRAIGRLAQVPLSVLVTGETGTGKELVARALHRESPRAAYPFVALNTAAIPAELLESELFGHEAGAFTGAQKRHMGRFEQANGGTLFLDEIGDMPAALQTRLLRVLAEGEFFRVGGRELIHVDVRVIAATHQPLETLAEQGRFRADLLHRLDVVRLRLPPLRERRADIPLLAARFLEHATHKLGIRNKTLTVSALQQLTEYAWPGNVRELENVCWRLAALTTGTHIGLSDLNLALPKTASREALQADDWVHALHRWARAELSANTPELHNKARKLFDQTLLEAALEHCNDHRSDAADALGLSRNTVTRKLGSSRKPR